MYNTLITGAYAAFAVWFFFAGGLSIASHQTGRRNFDYLVLAAINWLMALSTVAFGTLLFFSAMRHVAGFRVAWSIGFTTAAFAIAGLIQFAAKTTRKPLSNSLAWGLYGSALLVSVGACFKEMGTAPLASVIHTVFGLPVRTFYLSPDPVFMILMIMLPVGVLFAVVFFGRAYLMGKQGTLLVFLAAGLLGLAVLNDWLFHSLGRSSLLFVPLSFSLFDFAIGLGFVKRYAIVRRKVSRQRKKLSIRSSELQKSHEALNVVRSELGKKEQLAAIGEMASIIAHEVRNPLAVITNASSSLKKKELRAEDRQVLLAILEEETLRLNRLVSDLLNYARPIAPQRTRLLLLELLEQTAVRVDSGGVEVRVEKDCVQGQVWGDADLLRQTFDNLVMNAIQATGEGGLVSLLVKTASRNDREGYLVTITDDGEGMDTMIRNRAKDPFFTTRPTGTGLGLAIVGRIIEAHGGEMWFDSRAGEGTVVSIFLPLGMDLGVPASQRIRDTLPPRSEEPSMGD